MSPLIERAYREGLWKGPIDIRLDQPPLLIDSGARQLICVYVVLEKCSEAKERSVEAENGSRLSPPVETICIQNTT